jgi:poly-gamma-glutamate synthesis protein (capsule biosynthesis protein)
VSSIVRLAAVGDVGLIGAVQKGIRQHGGRWMLEAVSPAFRDVDVSLFNLEMPFALPRAPRLPHVREEFRVPTDAVSALAFPGIRVACLANNHIMDFGAEGLRTTRAVLAEAGISDVGAGDDERAARAARIVEVRGRRVGILAFAQPGPHTSGSGAFVAAAQPGPVLESIRSLRPVVDLLVVQLHHGAMYVDVPTPDGRTLARAAAEAGADLVLGHHPHVVQGIERSGRSVIAHSLGEFVFDPTVGHVVAHHAAERRRQSFVLRVEVSATGLEVERVPVVMSSTGRPERSVPGALCGQQT